MKNSSPATSGPSFGSVKWYSAQSGGLSLRLLTSRSCGGFAVACVPLKMHQYFLKLGPSISQLTSRFFGLLTIEPAPMRNFCPVAVTVSVAVPSITQAVSSPSGEE
jgi:hypothetical protein